MTEKIIQTRIINKNSSLGEWLEGKFNQESNITGADRLKQGEIALACVEVPKPTTDGDIKNTLVYLMKIGDGEKTFSELEWLSAPASDVYAWAKATDITYSQGILTLKQGAQDGGDLTFDFSECFYTKDELDALLAQKADVLHGKHLVWSRTLPEMNGKATVGVSDYAARADHVHPTDITRAPVEHKHTLQDLPEAMPPIPHRHDEVYYDKTFIDNFTSDINDALQKKAGLGHNHDKIYTTPDQVDQKCTSIAKKYLSQIGRALTYKGSLESTEYLPESIVNNIGDLWSILTDCEATEKAPAVLSGDIVAWNGEAWVLLGSSMKFNFYEKEEADEKFTNKPAFASVSLGNAAILTAKQPEDVFTLEAGENIELLTFSEGNKVVIKAVDTNSRTSIHIGNSGISNSVLGDQAQEDPYIKVFDDTQFRNQIQLKGDASQDNGIIKVASTAAGVISISAFPSEYTYIFDGGLATDV